MVVKVDLRHLRYFVAVADQGSFVRAAARLHVAQPALSRQVRGLEREVGAQLLERGRRGVRLTAAGEILRQGSLSLLTQLEAAMHRTHLAHDGKIGTCRLGIGRVALANDLVSRGITGIRHRFPNLQLIVTEMNVPAQVRAVRAADLDLAIGADQSPYDPGIEWEALYADPIECAVVPTSHALASAAVVSAEQLKTEVLWLMPAGSLPPIMQRIADALERVGITQWEEHESIESLFALVAAGRGWTVGTRSMRKNPPEGTVAIPLEGFRAPLDMVMVWRGEDGSPVVRNVLDVLREVRDRKAIRTATTRAARTRRQAAGVPRGLELRHLRALIVTTEEGSLSRAARRLGVTQSGVSRQIQELEREVGCRLLQRRAHGVVPTYAGDLLKHEAAVLLAEADDAVAHARRVDRGVQGRCVLGVVAPAVTDGLVSNVVREVGQRFPKLSTIVEEIPTPQQVAALRARRIDVGIAHAYPGLVDDPAITAVRLLEDTLECALFASTHPLAGRSWVRARDLANEPFLFMPRSFHPGFYDAVMEAFDEIGLVPRIDATFDGLRTVWMLAANGMGWAIGSRAQRANPPPELTAIPIEGLHIPWGFELLWRRDETEDAILATLGVLREVRPKRDPV